ncbi:hypothetical protein [Streptomyces sp. NPDC004376]
MTTPSPARRVQRAAPAVVSYQRGEVRAVEVPWWQGREKARWA